MASLKVVLAILTLKIFKIAFAENPMYNLFGYHTLPKEYAAMNSAGLLPEDILGQPKVNNIQDIHLKFANGESATKPILYGAMRDYFREYLEPLSDPHNHDLTREESNRMLSVLKPSVYKLNPIENAELNTYQNFWPRQSTPKAVMNRKPVVYQPIIQYVIHTYKDNPSRGQTELDKEQLPPTRHSQTAHPRIITFSMDQEATMQKNSESGNTMVRKPSFSLYNFLQGISNTFVNKSKSSKRPGQSCKAGSSSSQCDGNSKNPLQPQMTSGKENPMDVHMHQNSAMNNIRQGPMKEFMQQNPAMNNMRPIQTGSKDQMQNMMVINQMGKVSGGWTQPNNKQVGFSKEVSFSFPPEPNETVISFGINTENDGSSSVSKGKPEAMKSSGGLMQSPKSTPRTPMQPVGMNNRPNPRPPTLVPVPMPMMMIQQPPVIMSTTANPSRDMEQGKTHTPPETGDNHRRPKGDRKNKGRGGVRAYFRVLVDGGIGPGNMVVPGDRSQKGRDTAQPKSSSTNQQSRKPRGPMSAKTVFKRIWNAYLA